MIARRLVAATALLLLVLAPAATSADIEDAADRPFQVIAHRGQSFDAPEHTLAAYDRAVASGADFIEQDVQLTLDGALVVLHDDTLDRTARGPAANCTGPVRTKTLAQLRTCEVGSWFNTRFPDRADPAFVGERIPTLAEVFARYGDRVSYHIETKTPEAAPFVVERELIRLLDVYGLRGPAVRDWQVLIQSFSPASLQRFSALDPALPLVQLLATVPPAPAREAFLDAVAGYAIAIGPSNGGVTPALVDQAHARCLDVHPYTVNDPVRMAELVEAGVDGIFTDRPDVLLAVIDRALPEGAVTSDEPRRGAAANRGCRAQRDR
jgi:glycerophosphoryl diester phosphodiesterase